MQTSQNVGSGQSYRNSEYSHSIPSPEHSPPRIELDGPSDSYALLAEESEADFHRIDRSTKATSLLDILPPKLQALLAYLHAKPPRGLQWTPLWIQGPEKPRLFSVKPAFRLPYLDRLTDKSAWYLVSSAILVWLILFPSFLYLYSGCQVSGFDSPLRLSCISRPWRDSAACGLHGVNCRPFHNVSYAFRCPANCGSVQVLEPYTIGDQVIDYQSLVIGGHVDNRTAFKYLYRGDSFICGAAIHAGLIRDAEGGAAVVKLIGEQSNFPTSSENGIQSLDFIPRFPLSFTFEDAGSSGGSLRSCKDPRWIVLLLTIWCQAFISMFSRSASTFFATILISAYFCVSLAADAPEPSSYYKVISLALRGFLPAAFVGYFIYRFCVKRTLDNFNAPMERTLLWLGPFWLGALNNLTFDKLPIQRLTPHDLSAQPGAILVFIIILLIIFLIAIGQIYALRLEGRLPRYLLLYLAIGLLILLLAAAPNMHLRLHHYIIALIFLPGTALQTRPSMIYQGLLVGLFVNGIARWGFDSVLQVPADLFATDPSGLVPHVRSPEVVGRNISFAWDALGASTGYDSVSVLVNDVERYRGYEDHDEATGFAWTRDEGVDEPTFFRFGFVKYGRVGAESVVGRYSNPGTWLSNGTWIPPKEDG